MLQIRKMLPPNRDRKTKSQKTDAKALSDQSFRSCPLAPFTPNPLKLKALKLCTSKTPASKANYGTGGLRRSSCGGCSVAFVEARRYWTLVDRFKFWDCGIWVPGLRLSLSVLAFRHRILGLCFTKTQMPGIQNRETLGRNRAPPLISG